MLSGSFGLRPEAERKDALERETESECVCEGVGVSVGDVAWILGVMSLSEVGTRRGFEQRKDQVCFVIQGQVGSTGGPVALL